MELENLKLIIGFLINSNNGDNITIEAENIIIATGSVPITLPDIEN